MGRTEAIAKLRRFAPALEAMGATSLFLFGSTARDEAGRRSDLDLFLDIDPAGRFDALDLVAAKRMLEEGLGVAIDLTTRNGLHPLIREDVEAQSLRVF